MEIPPTAKPRSRFVYIPALGPGLRGLLYAIFFACAFLGATGVYQLAVRGFEWYRQESYQTYFSLLMTTIHIAVGLLLIVPFLFFGGVHLVTAWNRPNKVAVRLGVVVLILGVLTAITGILLIRLEGLPQLPTETIAYWSVFWGHVIIPVIAIWAYVLHRQAGPAIQWQWGYAWAGSVGVFIAIMLGLHSQNPQRWFAKGSPEGEKYFEPSRARTIDGNFIDAKSMMLDEYCMKCHQDVYDGHIHSVHRFSSFNNPAYLFSVRETRKVAGVRASRWCAGCHDPVPFFSGQFDDPKFDDEKNPTAHAGITCVVCHSITHVASRSGNGDYTIEDPPHYPFTYSENEWLQWLNNQMIRAKPDLHKKTFLKPFHRSEEFCSTCHKVGLPQEVTHYKEFLRGQNHPDSYFLSGVSGHGALAFYNPPVAKTRCAECHMALLESEEFGAQDFDGSGKRKIHDHRFLGGNTGIHALVNHSKRDEAIARVRDFLLKGPDGKSPILRADIFGIRHLTDAQQGIDAPLMNGDAIRPKLPLLKPGQSYLVDVVLRTVNMGHHLTQGTVDSNELWVEFIAKSGGKILARSGQMSGEDEGEVDPASHFINVLLLDRHGNRIDRRNPQNIFVPMYDHQIPPGAANVVHYRLNLPAQLPGPVELSVRVRYRKFDQKYMEFVYGQGKGPKLPIVDMAKDQVTLPVEGVATQVPEQKSPIAPPWQRWNDFGIACYLEGGPEGTKEGELGLAKLAFERVLSAEFEKFPEREAHGHLNLGRVYFANRGQDTKNLELARKALEKSRSVEPKAPWQTVAWFNGLINIENTNLDEALENFEQILDPKNRDPVKKYDYTVDFRVINRYAGVLVKKAIGLEGDARNDLLRKAVAKLERTLQLDAENIEAHDLLARIHALLGSGRNVSFVPPAPAPQTSGTVLLEKIDALAKSPVNHPDRLENAKNIKRLLDELESKSSVISPEVLLVANRELFTLHQSADAMAFRMALYPAMQNVDRLMLHTLPALAKQYRDGKASKEKRGQAGAMIEKVLQQLRQQPPQEDMLSSMVSTSSWPTPGHPISMALAGAAVRNHLQGPLYAPRLLVFQAIRPGLMDAYAKEADPELQTLAFRSLAAMHRAKHGIYRVDDNARDHTVALHRSRFPLAARASHPIVIYDLR